MRRCTVAGSCRFLSTLSLRRATRGRNPPPRTSTISIHALLAESDGGPGGKNAVILHFYPRSPCGERRFPISAHCFDGGISIHALLAESDNSGRPHAGGVFPFLSTLSLRRATRVVLYIRVSTDISIHALLAESDDIKLTDAQYLELFLSTLSLRRATPGSRRRLGRAGHFYPRSPCGERPMTGWGVHDLFEFLSTLSLRRATLL